MSLDVTCSVFDRQRLIAIKLHCSDFKKSIDFDTFFFHDRYTFILQTSSDVIDLTCMFYQTKFQHILNCNFVLNKGIYNGIFWAQVKYDKIYMCVVLVHFLTSRMSIFENFLLYDISLTV